MGKARLVKTFIDLVKIDSVSGDEIRIHKILKEKLTNLGLTVVEDGSSQQTKLGADNLIAKLSGKSTQIPLLFSTHTDTVEPGKGIEVVEKNDVLYSKGNTILGADDKAGIAIILEAIQRILENNLKTGDVEFIFSPGEEIGLIGASALNMNQIEAEMGYVLDSEGAVGRVTTASPTLYMYDVKISGKAAHAGIEINKGISALKILYDALGNIKTGQIDEQTTANIGLVEGGKASNIVMDSMTVKGEVRSVNAEKAEKLIKRMKISFENAAQQNKGNVEIDIKKMAVGYDIKPNTAVMSLLKKSNKILGNTVIQEVSGGGSDANIFNEHGKQVVNLSIGYDKIHTTNERLNVREMEKAVQLVMNLIENAPEKGV